MNALPGSVLVGVTGPGENTEALRFALDEARRLDRPVTLVHAVAPAPPPPPGGVLVTYEESWAELARTIVADVAGELAELQAAAGTDVRVATVVGHGSPGSLLSELSRDAARVVLQHQHVHRLVRMVTGSTTARVAAHAHCPVVSVPAAEQEDDAIPREDLLVVGVHEDGGPREVVRAATAQAALHGWGTRLLHAWRLPGAYDELLADDEHWRTAALDSLHRVAVRLGAEEEGPTPDARVVHDWAPDALVEASRTARMVVVGRHGRRGPLSPRLGSRARAVLAGAHCPVMVVPLAEDEA
ncbi:universal stress protein [Nocardioides solisilvae]|uniref:universal stress protein n=1 Tax=Nocardioides solisilvae TaxID=1542435 RepID=UPI000D750007|nr:universal stress protein [Nocardioides solisilvae]